MCYVNFYTHIYLCVYSYLSYTCLYRYHDIIIRQKSISEAGSQQLLLDTYSLKTLLLHLHSLGAQGGNRTHNPIPTIYSKFVNTRATQVETVLKLIGTPSSMLIERFRIMWPEGSMDDLSGIMTLKGIRKQEQQILLDSQPALVAAIPIPTVPSTSSTGGVGGTNTAAVGAISSSQSAVASASLGALAVASSMGKLTQDLSTSLSAVGNLKWGSSTTLVNK